MKKKIVILFFILLVIAGVVSIVKYNNYKNSLVYTVTQISEENYFVMMQNNKYGVINKYGDVVVEPSYDIIEIPNPKDAMFICKSNYNQESKSYSVKVLDDSGNQLLYQYYYVEAIALKNVNNNGQFEKSVLKYKANDKYGLIDFSGKKITDAIYDSIEGVDYKEGMLLVSKNGKYGVINMNGAKIIKPEYDEITCDGYYTDEDGYSKSGFVVGKRTDDGMRYGYIDCNNKKILDTKYNEIDRVLEKKSDDVYLVAFLNGKAGLFQNKKCIINNDYEDILYNQSYDLLTLQKSSKQGVSKLDGTIVIPIEYDGVSFYGQYINVNMGENVSIFNTNGENIENSEYISSYEVSDGKYKIVSTKNDEYKILNGSSVVENGYSYIGYLFDDYFYAMKGDKFGIIDANGDNKIDFKYNSISKIESTNVVQLLNYDENSIFLNKNLEQICKIKNPYIFCHDKYIKIQNSEEVYYFDFDGNELTNKEIYNNNELFAFKEKSKWGFKNANDDVIVKAKYDFVTEFNEYGYAGIKKDGKWGVINQSGEIIVEPTTEIDESIEVTFLKNYYRAEYGYESYFVAMNE